MIATESVERIANPSYEKPNFCPTPACRFCGLGIGDDDLFMELHGEVPFLPIPRVPASLMTMLCAFPLGHHGGHVLLAPRRHYLSLARFPRQDELAEAMSAVAGVLEAMFPMHWLFAFEHGPGELEHRPVKCGGCHVDHAHGHVLVLDSSIAFDDVRALAEETLEGLGWDLASQAHEQEAGLVNIGDRSGEQPYLHIARLGRHGEARTYRQEVAGQSIPSQLLRRLVATAAGRATPTYWNWKIALQHNLRGRLDEYKRAALGFKRELRAFLADGTPAAVSA